MTWYALLEEFGCTPSEWGAQEDYQRVFLEEGFKEKMRRQSGESEQQS